MLRLSYDRGTLVIHAPPSLPIETLPFVAVDAGGVPRAPASSFDAIARFADAHAVPIADDPRARFRPEPRPIDGLALRAYQAEALAAWSQARRRGVVALPTGAGKTRVAIAAILSCGVPTLVLCPTRALLVAWADELARWGLGPVGVWGDGERTVTRTTVMTFESAYRHLDELGDRFGLLVVDEVHHFAGGQRVEALEACMAPCRLGLTATAPPEGSEGRRRLDEEIGEVVHTMEMAALVGRHLAPLSIERIAVRLEPQERVTYERCLAPFREHARAYHRIAGPSDYAAFAKWLGSTPAGRRAMRDRARALDIAYFPNEKRRRVRALLARHRTDRTIVFTARTEDAFRVAEDSLIPVITAEVGAAERERILAKLREGRIRAVVSARVLNEGIDVPDARVAIVVAGTLGLREHVQRIGRILRPAPDKHAIAYELVTVGTTDERALARAHGGFGDVRIRGAS